MKKTLLIPEGKSGYRSSGYIQIYIQSKYERKYRNNKKDYIQEDVSCMQEDKNAQLWL